MLPSLRPTEHNSRDPKQQGNAGATAFHVTVPNLVHPLLVTFNDYAQVRENAPYHYLLISSYLWLSRSCAPYSNVGHGPEHIQPSTANDANDEFLQVSSYTWSNKIFELSKDNFYSNELEEEFMNTIRF